MTDEIVRLCEGYSIVSEYASFIVLENDAEYRRWKIDRKNATRIQRDRRAQQAVRERLERMRADAAAKLGPASTESTKPTAAPPSNTSSGAQPNQSNPAPSRPGNRSNGFDLNLPGGGGGGGAIDPITGTILISLGVGGLVASRKRRNEGAA